jgi:hypothetical protein
MYIIGFTVIAIILFYAGTIIFDGLTYFTRQGQKHFTIGNPWYYALVFINLIILIFVMYFYYHKSSVGSIGRTGIEGERGRKGKSGNKSFLSSC